MRPQSAEPTITLLAGQEPGIAGTTYSRTVNDFETQARMTVRAFPSKNNARGGPGSQSQLIAAESVKA